MRHILNFILTVLSVVWKGFVTKTLWFWYVVPIFAVRELSIVQAIGLGLAVTMLTYVPNIREIRKAIEEGKEENTFENKLNTSSLSTIWGFIWPSLMLFAGFVYHFFL